MTVHLLPVLDRYFAAQNAHDIEAMVACFALCHLPTNVNCEPAKRPKRSPGH